MVSFKSLLKDYLVLQLNVNIHLQHQSKVSFSFSTHTQNIHLCSNVYEYLKLLTWWLDLILFITEIAVRLRTNISETVKRKLSLGASILRVGGVEKVFKKFFSMEEGERLLKVSQCYLSTTSGPLAGFLFISTYKVAFCSEKSMKVFTQNGHMLRIRYKVSLNPKPYIHISHLDKLNWTSLIRSYAPQVF